MIYKTLPRSFSGTFFKLHRLKYQLLAVLIYDIIKASSCILFPYFFKPQRLQYQLLSFLVHDVIKHYQYFYPYFLKLQRLKYQLLAVLVHGVIKIFSRTFLQ